MYSIESRQKISASCKANQYAKLFEVNSGDLGGNFFHSLQFHVEAAEANTANVTVVIQTRATSSDDWANETVVGTAIRPGGWVDVSQVFYKAMARVLITSTANASVTGTLLFPGEQSGVAVDSAVLSCGTACEVISET